MTNGELQHDVLQAAASIRFLAGQSREFEKKASQFDKLGAVKTALAAMIERGLITQPHEVLEKLGELLDSNSEDLAVLTKAAQLKTPTFTDLARATDERDPESGGSATTRFTSLILR